MSLEEISGLVGHGSAATTRAIYLDLLPDGEDPERIYRLTSPVYWIVQIARAVVRLVGTARGRVVAAVGAVVLVILGAVVNGWASAFFTKLFGEQ